MKLFFVFLIAFSVHHAFAQTAQEVEDSLDLKFQKQMAEEIGGDFETGGDFGGASDFDGIMNDHIHHLLSEDSTMEFKSFWKNNVTITYNENPVHLLKDTLWLCVLDSIHDRAVIPVKNAVVTSHFGIRYGRNHNGTDLDLETGDTVYAAFDGVIRYGKYHQNGFGNLIIARHFNGLETYYAHLSKLLVEPNSLVKAGDPIGLGGNTGRSSGSHLHFEIRFYDQPIDPELVFDFKKGIVTDPNLFVHSGVFEHSRQSTTKSSGKNNTTAGSKKYHKVRSGDTLGAIAQKNRTSVSRLCSLNHIKSTSTLHIGQTIRIR
ncbi:MAG: peptidoglycan DD-metalloendopeptidase family protein [Crocinitomicaceae bacterium]